ncbi:MAG: hypothetical protein R3301_01785 [Saprospiraceae bacterium]|nr:hypothetical protein [Saprospiraceae bacterium]
MESWQRIVLITSALVLWYIGRWWYRKREQSPERKMRRLFERGAENMVDQMASFAQNVIETSRVTDEIREGIVSGNPDTERIHQLLEDSGWRQVICGLLIHHQRIDLIPQRFLNAHAFLEGLVGYIARQSIVELKNSNPEVELYSDDTGNVFQLLRCQVEQRLSSTKTEWWGALAGPTSDTTQFYIDQVPAVTFRVEDAASTLDNDLLKPHMDGLIERTRVVEEEE